MVSSTYCFFLLVFFSCLSGSEGVNILLTSVGHAGHVIPLFELAKALQHHNVTFVTQQVAQSYVNFTSHPNPSSFHLIFSTNTSEDLEQEKQMEQDLVAHAANHSFFDSLGYTMELMKKGSERLSTTLIYVLMKNQFDLIIGNSVLKQISSLAHVANIPCVIQSTEVLPNLFDFNTPNIASGLTRKDFTQWHYRLYNVIFNIRIVIRLVFQLLPNLLERSNEYPRVPGPYNDSLSLKNIFRPPKKCLELFSISPTLHTVSESSPYQKYLGALIDRSSIETSNDQDLEEWIQSKADQSIIYGAFGTSSLIGPERMMNLISGLAEFLVDRPDASLLLVFRGQNFQTYRTVLPQITEEKYQTVLTDRRRVRIDDRFVPQKWILDQSQVKIFVSHCGMGSASEGIYFHKVILCMPFNMDQFINGMAIVESKAGQSLFHPPSLFQSFLHPHHFHDYRFSSLVVREKLMDLWTDAMYQRSIEQMSLEMKHAGGVDGAVKEIEHFLALDGNYDRYVPFPLTLPFYQRYLFDVFFLFLVLPLIFIRCGYRRWSRSGEKIKKD